MASNINPNNIDGAYPVAGQDNNSQGFRDNFTNTKLNFQYAEDEINDLQAKVLLKAPLDGSTTVNNNMGNQLLYNAQIRDFSETRVAIAETSGGIVVDYSNGHYQTITTSGTITLSFTNWPPVGQYGWVRLQIHVTNTSHLVRIPTNVTLGVNNLQGYYVDDINGPTIAFNSTGYYVFEFTTYNAPNNTSGTVTIQDLSRNLDPIFLPSSQDLSSGGAASTTVTTSYFSTSAGTTGTLAAGKEGQIKVFIMQGNSGAMAITVTNYGWVGTHGRLTFNAVGQACTLQYINGHWFVIGNNGVTLD